MVILSGVYCSFCGQNQKFTQQGILYYVTPLNENFRTKMLEGKKRTKPDKDTYKTRQKTYKNVYCVQAFLPGGSEKTLRYFHRQIQSERTTNGRIPFALHNCAKYVWLRMAVTAKMLDRIVDYLVHNCRLMFPCSTCGHDSGNFTAKRA